MGKCNIDHSQEDVLKKLKSQEAFLPQEISAGLNQFLRADHSQETLNEVFHLLKKYDLASEGERGERNRKLAELVRKAV